MSETAKRYRVRRLVEDGHPVAPEGSGFPVTGEQTQAFAAYAAVLPEKGRMLVERSGRRLIFRELPPTNLLGTV